ncbi:hypothetical protein MMC20_004113 [Loxospora ochrophaea]|nr:hypothetical protein [Loxospora ochrophaea]
MEQYLASRDTESPVSRHLARNSRLPSVLLYQDLDYHGVSRPNEGTSMLHSGSDSLAALTGGASSRTRTESVGTSVGGRALDRQRVLQASGPDAPLGIPHRPIMILECPFHFLCCDFTSTNESEWRAHSLQHFSEAGPPETSNCCFCDASFSGNSRWQSWEERMDHVLFHHRLGHRLATARPDFELYEYLWTKRIIIPAQYKDLMSGYRQRQAAGAYISPPVSPVETSARAAYTVSNQRRSRDERR